MKKYIPIFIMLLGLLFAAPVTGSTYCLPVIFTERPFVAPPYPLYQGGDCTWFAWEMTYQVYNVQLPYAGNAKDWLSLAGADVTSVDGIVYHLSLSDTPAVNSIRVEQTGAYGHVSWVADLTSSGPEILQSLMYPTVGPAQAPDMYWQGCFWEENWPVGPAQYLTFTEKGPR